MKSGLVALVGRPNVGKSTLLNALLGQKRAIVSDKPQTTRSAVRGVLHRPEGQIVLDDTTGLHKPRTLLGQPAHLFELFADPKRAGIKLVRDLLMDAEIDEHADEDKE